MEIYALLLVMWPKAIEPEQHIPAPIPYVECVEIATRLARYYDHVMWKGQPIITCKEVTK
jgi:hypothetical protein